MNNAPLLDQSFYFELMHIFAILFTIILISGGIITLIRTFLDYRIKNKLVDKGAPDAIVTQLLQPHTRENKNANIKWVCILGGIGAGLGLINFFQPLGIHSLAIMSFCLAAAFLSYHLFTKNSEKNS